MIYNNLESEISDVVPELLAITCCSRATCYTLYQLNAEMVQVLKKVCKDFASFILIKVLGLNITLTEKLSKRQKIFVQTIMFNGKSFNFSNMGVLI